MDALGQLTAALAGRYTIERELGAGGMATVYLAHDVRHDRRVALKLLRPELAAVIGAERFLREIRTTANLQHPHILPLFDSGEAGSQLFYVMPLAEGESLRDRLDREKQLGVEESVRIATEVAAALDYAHRHGVVHRDVKPANILLHDGSALVTDFGIALAIRNAGADRITETGLSLGTPHYMSPEQATGDRDIGARSDVYSLAAVLYEMLAGEPPHSGGTIQAVIAKVLTEIPRPLGGLRTSVPVHVALAVEQALAKVPADRFATAAEFAEALRNPGITSTRSRATMAAHSAPRARPSWQVGALVAGTLALGALGGWTLRRPAPPEVPAVVRFDVSPDSGWRLQDRPALSPDGSMMVYSAASDQGVALFLRRLDELVSRRLTGTEGAEGPFFSPDGKSIGFVSNYQLRTLRLDGGAPVIVARVSTFFLGGTWAPDNTILFTQFPAMGIYRVSTSGGPVDRIPLADSSAAPFTLSMVPGGRAVLMTTVGSSGPTLAVLDLRNNSLRRLGPGLGPQFVPPHWLVFATSDGQLYRQQFDPAALDTVGSREPVVSGVRVENSQSLPIFAAAPNGSVASLASGTALSNMMLVDRSGNDQELFAGNQVWAPRFSPDGKLLAYGQIFTGKTESDVWIRDLANGANQRLTLEANDANDPVWSPDGKSILYSSNDGRSVKDLFVRSVDGVDNARPVLRRPETQWNSDWGRDGVIVFTDLAPDSTGWNIWSINVDDSASAKPFLATPFQEAAGRLSPDGRWITYHSNETGRTEVYVQSFPAPGSKTLISTNGGRDGVWSADGRAIYYWRSVDLMMASVTATGGGVVVGKRERLFQYPAYITGAHANYDVSPDGRSFAIVSGGPTANRLTVALNLIR